MLRSNVLYHGSRFGFKNLFFMDGSSDRNAIQFLQKVNRSLGVNVMFSNATLNQLTDEMNKWAQSFTKSDCEDRSFVVKLDTDELIGHFDPISREFSSNKNIIVKYLNELKDNDGSRYLIKYSALSCPPKYCSQEVDSVQSATTFEYSETRKMMVPSHTLLFIDLGGHDSYGYNHQHQPDKSFRLSNLSIFHYRYDHMIKLELQAILSHGYVLVNDSKEIKISKLQPMAEGFPATCNVNSCHKVFDYLQYLLNSSLHRENYNSVSSSSSFIDTSIANEIVNLQIKYAKEIEF